jgi:hypothetical protein
MDINRRNFITTAIVAAMASRCYGSGSASAAPSCSFTAPLNVLARAGVRINPSTTFKGEHDLLTSRSKTHAQELSDTFSQETIQLALGMEYVWLVPKLAVAFLGNVDSSFQNKVTSFVKDWTPYSGIEFSFVTQLPADIRIELVSDGQNWSQYGTDATKVGADEATVHFGTINQYSGDDDIYRVAVHEFGHVLGALHEHQSPSASGIDWNTEVVNDYYHGLGWTDAMIQANVYATFPSDATYCTRLDPSSIMIYDFPPDFTMNHLSVKPNFVLSDLDKSGMKLFYDQARSKKM